VVIRGAVDFLAVFQVAHTGTHEADLLPAIGIQVDDVETRRHRLGTGQVLPEHSAVACIQREHAARSLVVAGLDADQQCRTRPIGQVRREGTEGAVEAVPVVVAALVPPGGQRNAPLRRTGGRIHHRQLPLEPIRRSRG
jgi:hypothetical protein